MEVLIITKNKNSTSDEVFHPLIDTAKSLGEKAYLLPINSKFGVYHEFQIGAFEPNSLDLVVKVPPPDSPDETKLIINSTSNYYELSASNQKFNMIRLAIVRCDDDELLFRFCKSYLYFQRDHQISYEGRHDRLLSFEKIVELNYQSRWYDNIGNFTS